MDEKKSLDILGIKPVGDAVNTTVRKTLQGIEGFLKSVCAPALDEVGLMLKDHVRHWRLNNVLKILEKSKGKLKFEEGELKIHAHPRVALSIIENGSLSDNDIVQELWAGLFASSCTESGQDDENLIFVNLLNLLTVAEVKILKYSCENAEKILYPNGLVLAGEMNMPLEQLVQLTGISNIHRLDRELDHLRSLELISGGFGMHSNDLIAEVHPTGLALNLYVRCQGYHDSTAVFWKDTIITSKERDELIVEKKRQEQELKKKDIIAE